MMSQAALRLVVKAANRLRVDRDGATLIEYALLLVLVAVVCVMAVMMLGHHTNNLLNAAAHSL
jgi:pilus assembly protein Flp/PilA